MTALAVDPGKTWCGYARGYLEHITECGLHPSDAHPLSVRGNDTAVCEIPQVYHGRNRVDPADLIAVAAAAGRACALHTVRYVKPAAWKGQLPKNVQHARMWAALTPEETEIVRGVSCLQSLRHNVYDAVCLLLTTYGRM